MQTAFGADPRPRLKFDFAPGWQACIRDGQARLGRPLTSEEIRQCTNPSTSSNTTTWLAIGAGFVALAGVGFYLYKKRQAG